jgi:hypothetical protein
VTESDADVAIYWDFENMHACVLDELRGEGTYRTGSTSAATATICRHMPWIWFSSFR